MVIVVTLGGFINGNRCMTLGASSMVIVVTLGASSMVIVVTLGGFINGNRCDIGRLH